MSTSRTVATVLGPIEADKLGVVAVHEALLSVLPGAQYAPDIEFNRAEIFATIAATLARFREAGGGTVVDATGMFHGRDLPLLEALSAATGVHIVASTGLGPEELMGGYFLTPQTNPPTPWPAERFADLFAAEVTEGMVVPRLERRAGAGLITAVADRTGITATEQSLFRGSARAALASGASLALAWGADAEAEVDLALAEGLPAERIKVTSADRVGAPTLELAAKGVFLGIDHIGHDGVGLLNDESRADLVATLLDAGFGDQVLLSNASVAVAKGSKPVTVQLGGLLSDFLPRLSARGLAEAAIDDLLIANPARFLTLTAGGAK